ncbi:hypothetical protein Axi01nite_37710 [Actinoplanes xinjiangensis]|nr:hypothetical protein Axi01nite_37710 [Actinoplanes xinjiangensis]
MGGHQAGGAALTVAGERRPDATGLGDHRETVGPQVEAAEEAVGEGPDRRALQEPRDGRAVGGAEQRGRGPRVESQSGTHVRQLEGVLVGEGEPVHGPAPEGCREVGGPGALFLSEAVDGPGHGGGAVALPRAEQHPDPDRLAGSEVADVPGQQVGDAGSDADAEHGGCVRDVNPLQLGDHRRGGGDVGVADTAVEAGAGEAGVAGLDAHQHGIDPVERGVDLGRIAQVEADRMGMFRPVGVPPGDDDLGVPGQPRGGFTADRAVPADDQGFCSHALRMFL